MSMHQAGAHEDEGGVAGVEAVGGDGERGGGGGEGGGEQSHVSSR